MRRTACAGTKPRVVALVGAWGKGLEVGRKEGFLQCVLHEQRTIFLIFNSKPMQRKHLHRWCTQNGFLGVPPLGETTSPLQKKSLTFGLDPRTPLGQQFPLLKGFGVKSFSRGEACADRPRGR